MRFYPKYLLESIPFAIWLDHPSATDAGLRVRDDLSENVKGILLIVLLLEPEPEVPFERGLLDEFPLVRTEYPPFGILIFTEWIRSPIKRHYVRLSDRDHMVKAREQLDNDILAREETIPVGLDDHVPDHAGQPENEMTVPRVGDLLPADPHL